MSSLLHPLILLLISTFTSAQEYTPFPQISCPNPAARTASGFGKCDSMYSGMSQCDRSAGTDKTAAASCICRQEILNRIFDCENEENFCAGFSHAGISDVIDSWHRACDTRLTFAPTTPALSSVSSIDLDACKTAWDGCLSQSSELVKCASLTSSSPIGVDDDRLLSCLCGPPLLSAAFTCSYAANVSCAFVPATVTAVRGYAYCDNFMAVVGPLVSATPTGSRGSLSTLGSSLAATKPALPGASGSAKNPAATQRSSASVLALSTFMLYLVLLAAIAILNEE